MLIYVLREITMKVLCLFPFLVSSLCPCKFNENGIQLAVTGSMISINTRRQMLSKTSLPAVTFSTVELHSNEFGLTVNRTESDCMIFNVFGKVSFNLVLESGTFRLFRKSTVKNKIKKSHQVMSSSTVMEK